MRHLRTASSLTALALVALPLAACGGGDGGTADDAFKAHLKDRGPITYVQGKVNDNATHGIIDKWNKLHPEEKVTLKEQTDEADQQHDDLVRNFDAKNADYDVVSVDLVWTAEFAAKGYLQPLKGDLAVDTDGLLDSAVKGAQYNGVQYASPTTSDGGMLYYRTDLVKTPPTTWAELFAACDIARQAKIDCYAGQFNKYEGLTVNASEAINGAGGSIVAEDGKTPTVDSPEAAEGLQVLVDGFKNGDIPKSAITYTEEEGRAAFQAGKLLFLRNWPYVYGLASGEASSKVKGKFSVAPLPGLDGVGASTLGGHNTAISAFSDNKATAIDFVNFLASEEIQKDYMEKGSLAPIRADVYQDPALVKKYPYLPTLLTSIENAVARPITPFYQAVTKAIQDNSYAALKGDKTSEEAVKDMAAAIKAASGQ
ncbi:ABC transporter substrate-binding protein [Nocardioides cavernaquae]|uniref:ABC transporter substrate-binding protein n=1 Tax=Nocardioides cavernaquae TaxID=2321396 RepID=A0A3A5H5W7_9ACTN|nr:ABC transporter substrate-binding protein [Nocardioides cavernaquae]RJS45932.1 ABC transporter substrate-binding protein [Nocardioides cavernaquae]